MKHGSGVGVGLRRNRQWLGGREVETREFRVDTLKYDSLTHCRSILRSDYASGVGLGTRRSQWHRSSYRPSWPQSLGTCLLRCIDDDVLDCQSIHQPSHAIRIPNTSVNTSIHQKTDVLLMYCSPLIGPFGCINTSIHNTSRYINTSAAPTLW